MFNIIGFVLGALVGLVVTAAVAYMWPHGKLRWARPLVAAGLGGLAALVVMRLI